MRSTLRGLLLFLLVVVAPVAEADECAITEQVLPELGLHDRNPQSATYDTEVRTDALVGRVLVIYWAQAG